MSKAPLGSYENPHPAPAAPPQVVHLVPDDVRGILRTMHRVLVYIGNVLGNPDVTNDMQPVIDWLESIEDEERRCEL